MYTFPQVISVPLLSGAYVGSLDWPGMGSFLAWTLVAAFVGVILGVLRSMGRGAPEDNGRQRVAQVHSFPAVTRPCCDMPSGHKEAA